MVDQSRILGKFAAKKSRSLIDQEFSRSFFFLSSAKSDSLKITTEVVYG